MNAYLQIKNAFRRLVKPDSYFCDHLWTSISIRVSGEIEACSCAHSKGPLFSILDNPVKEIWNNEWFSGTRQYLLEKMNLKDITGEPEVFDCCLECPVSLQDRYYLNMFRLDNLLPDSFYSGLMKRLPDSIRKDKKENFKKLLKKLRNPLTEIDAFPIFATIDPSNICNLKCPFCPVGAGSLDHEKKFMDMDLFEKIIEKIGTYLLSMELYRYGEPLLNPDIDKMIRIAAKKYGILTTVSTNLAMPLSDDKLASLVNSGLYKLVVAADDIKQENYEKYRRGGKISIVLDNLERLIKIRRELKSGYPRIIWQNLIFSFNENRIGEIKKFVKKMGIDHFRATPAYIPKHEDYSEWIPVSAGVRGFEKKGLKYISKAEISPCIIDPGGSFTLKCSVKNHGKKKWPADHGEEGSIRIGIKFFDESEKIKGEMGRIHLEKDIFPGEEIVISAVFKAPESPGIYYLKIDMVKENQFWFEYNAELRSDPVLVKMEVNE
jgi:MoaA/NifB/PqqE/SkfB family radical SAM enzyme